MVVIVGYFTMNEQDWYDAMIALNVCCSDWMWESEIYLKKVLFNFSTLLMGLSSLFCII
jgi:hypothetical protein